MGHDKIKLNEGKCCINYETLQRRKPQIDPQFHKGHIKNSYDNHKKLFSMRSGKTSFSISLGHTYYSKTLPSANFKSSV